MSDSELSELEELKQIKAVYYCPIQRERVMAQIGHLIEPEAKREIDKLHAEREWLTHQLAEATGRSVSDIRHDFRESTE